MKNMLLLPALLLALCASAQRLEVRFDFSQARQTIALLQQKEQPSEIQLAQYARLPGSLGLAQKVRSNADTARSALLHAWQGKTVSGQERSFRFTGINKYRDTLASFLKQMEESTGTLSDSVSAALAPYAPEGRTTRVTVYCILGGPSMGFTLGDDTAFYLGLQFYGFDRNAVLESCKHELLHNIQSARYDSYSVAMALEKQDTAAAEAYSLLRHLFIEGSAEWLADLRRAPQTPKIRELAEHAAANDNRVPEVFYFFERTVLDVYDRRPGSDYDKAYSVLFDWNWNNPGYYLGYRMLKSLEAAHGSGVLKKYIAADPTVFLQDYIRLSHERPDLAPGKLSAAFEQMLENLIFKLNKLKR